MTPTDTQARHLKYSRFGRNSSTASDNHHSAHGRRRGHWTGNRPLEDAATQARLAALIDSADKQTEERE
jgi:hypothetical protein